MPKAIYRGTIFCYSVFSVSKWIASIWNLKIVDAWSDRNGKDLTLLIFFLPQHFCLYILIIRTSCRFHNSKRVAYGCLMHYNPPRWFREFCPIESTDYLYLKTHRNITKSSCSSSRISEFLVCCTEVGSLADYLHMISQNFIRQ